ncbi:MAG: DUF58 domain-containing protein [Chloroflexota bacterium]
MLGRQAASPPVEDAAPPKESQAPVDIARTEMLTVSQISKAWLWGAAAMLLIGAAANSRALFGLGLVLAVALLVAWVWAHWCLSNLHVERTFSQPRAFWGEEVEMNQVFVNNKPLPVPWLAVNDEYPGSLELLSHKTGSASRPRVMEFSTSLSLGWYERLTRHYHLKCTARGEHEFGPIEVRSGDIFGLFRRTALVQTYGTLLVYPRYVQVERLGLPARQPFGDSKSTLPLATDPLRLRGIREYAYGDNPRHVHWKATARRGVMQTKLFEPAATPQLSLFCNQDTFVHIWDGLDTSTLELTITVAASIANYALETGYMVGLQVNAFAVNSDRQVKVAPSRDPGQLTRILENLARIKGWSGLPMEELIRSQRHFLPKGTTVVVVTGVVTEDMLDILIALRRAGHPVTLVEAAGSDRAAEWAKRKSPEALRAQGITYYLVDAVDEAETLDSLVF